MEVPPGKLKPVEGKWSISTNLCRAGACVFREIFHMFLVMYLDCIVKSYMLSFVGKNN